MLFFSFFSLGSSWKAWLGWCESMFGLELGKNLVFAFGVVKRENIWYAKISTEK